MKPGSRIRCFYILNRSNKRRYLAILCSNDRKHQDYNYIVKLILKRYSELFGSIESQNSALKSIRSFLINGNNILILSCKLESLDNILLTMVFMDPPLITLDISGTVKRLKGRLDALRKQNGYLDYKRTSFFQLSQWGSSR